MGNLLRETIQGMAEACGSAIRNSYWYPHRLSGACGTVVLHTEEQDREVDCADGGRGQLRESDTRCHPAFWASDGRPLDYDAHLAQEVHPLWDRGQHYSITDAGDGGDRASTRQVGGSHYKDMKIQPHYFCHVNGLGALESNIIKYVCRHAMKHGKQDLEKARHYIDLLIEWEYKDEQS